jgi:hypothetical protein
MKKSFLVSLIAIATLGMYSCGSEDQDFSTKLVGEVHATEDYAMSTIDRKEWQPKTRMDSIFMETVNETKAFIDIYGDTLVHGDFWWDSDLAKDKEFNRIRICPLRNTLIIEKRPFPFKSNVPVAGISLERNFAGDYVFEKNYFEDNQEVPEKREQLHLHTEEEMKKAAAIFTARLEEARGHAEGFRKKNISYRLEKISE